MVLSLKQIARSLNGETHGDHVRAPGPGHSAADRSLSVKLTSDGEDVVVHTFSPADDRLAALKWVREKCGVQPKANGNGHADPDLAKLINDAVASQKTNKPKGKLAGQFDYTDADGVLLYQVQKFDGPRRYVYRQPDGKGWIYKAPERRVLYRLPDVMKGGTVFFCEGEKDADNLAALNLCTTTIASGKWTDECVNALADRDVVIMQDNDEAGIKRAQEAAKRLHGIASRVRICLLPDLPPKGDVTDWLDAGGDVDKLQRIIEILPDWQPPAETKSAPQADDSKPLPKDKSLVAYPLVAFADVSFTNEIAYLVQGLLPRSGLALVWGPKKSGKSFWIMDLALHVALGWPYRDRKVEQAAVIYLALEGQAGYGRRIEAFKQHHNIREAPFYLLRTAVNLVTKADEIIKNIAQQLTSVGLIVVDTMNRSLPGSESSDEDMSKYLNAAAKFVNQFGCLVVLVHHPGHDESRPRGHSALGAAVDAQIAVRRGADLEIICELELAKDDAAGIKVYSRLKTCEIGSDPHGDPIYSMVVVPSEKSSSKPVTSIRSLSPRQRTALDALDLATIDQGVAPTFQVASSVKKVVLIKHWRDAMFSNGTLNREDANPRSDFMRLRTQLKAHAVIGIHNDYVWRCSTVA